MNNIFDNITVRLPELHYFQQLLRKEKIYYFLELYETSTNSQELQTSGLKEGLQQFFDDLEFESTNELPYYESYDIGSDDHYNRVDILVDNENLVIESNSLKAVRSIKDKLVTNGGRIFSLNYSSDSMDDCKRYIYDNIGEIDFDGMTFRTDIGEIYES